MYHLNNHQIKNNHDLRLPQSRRKPWLYAKLLGNADSYAVGGLLFLYFGLDEIHETQTGQSRTVSLLDRDTFGDEVQLSEVVLAVGLLVQIVDNADQTGLQLFDTVASANLAYEASGLLVEILILVHPCIHHSGRNEFVLIAVRNGHDRFQFRAERRQVYFVHCGQMSCRRQYGGVSHDIEVRDPGVEQSHVIRTGMQFQIRLATTLGNEESVGDEIPYKFAHFVIVLDMLLVLTLFRLAKIGLFRLYPMKGYRSFPLANLRKYVLFFYMTWW